MDYTGRSQGRWTAYLGESEFKLNWYEMFNCLSYLVFTTVRDRTKYEVRGAATSSAYLQAVSQLELNNGEAVPQIFQSNRICTERTHQGWAPMLRSPILFGISHQNIPRRNADSMKHLVQCPKKRQDLNTGIDGVPLHAART